MRKVVEQREDSSAMPNLEQNNSVSIKGKMHRKVLRRSGNEKMLRILLSSGSVIPRVDCIKILLILKKNFFQSNTKNLNI